MTVPKDYKYTKTHEWVKIDGDVATVGLTEFAQSELGDITYLELPESGMQLSQSDSFGVVESVKAASDIYSPVSGEVIEGNSEAEDAPEIVNQSPFEDAWLIKVRIADPSQLEGLMDANTYEQYVEESGGH